MGNLIAVLVLCAPLAAQGNMALSVDGDDDAMHVLSHPSLEPTEAITIEAWIKGLGSVSHGRIIRKADDFGDGYMVSWSFQGNAVGGLIDCNGHDDINDPTPNTEYEGEWHHLAFTSAAGGFMRLYVDGELVISGVAPDCMAHTGDLWIGAFEGDKEEFIGEVDEVRIWSVERTPDEIMQSMFQALGPTPGLEASWHFDGHTMDSAGGNDGVLFGDAHLVPSDSPVAFAFAPDRGDWRGGTEVVLSGGFEGLTETPTVTFDGVPSPSVTLLDTSTVVAVTPEVSAPGLVADVGLQGNGFSMSGADEFTHTPRLDAEATTKDDRVDVSLLLEPPRAFAVFVGPPIPAGVENGRFDWKMEAGNGLVVFTAEAPFQDAVSFSMRMPDLPFESVAMQALVGGGHRKATFSNAVVVTP